MEGLGDKGDRRALTRGQWRQAACFSLCFLAFMLAEAAVNARAAAHFGTGLVTPAYALGLLCTGLGFLSFPLLRRLVVGERGRRAATLLSGALCAVCAVLLLTTAQPALFAPCAALCLLSCGHVGGCVYYDHAMAFRGSPWLGRVTGTGMALAVLLQFLLQSVIPLEVVSLIGLVASVLLTVLLASGASRDRAPAKPPARPAHDGAPGREALILVAAVVLMSLVSGIIDGVVTAFDGAGTYDVYQGVRLFYALGLLAAGWAADLRERRLLPLAAACFILLSSVSTALLASPAGYFAGMAVMYAYSGFYVIFLTVPFCDFAPRTPCPELWAGMGRVARCLAVAVVAPPMPWLYGAWGSTVLTVASCLLSVAVLLVLLPLIARGSQGEGPLSPDQALERFCQSCGLTPRESEVLRKLLESEDSLQAISSDLAISVRMVQRYVTSIYEKTGAKSRMGLHQRYTQHMLENR